MRRDTGEIRVREKPAAQQGARAREHPVSRPSPSSSTFTTTLPPSTEVYPYVSAVPSLPFPSLSLHIPRLSIAMAMAMPHGCRWPAYYDYVSRSAAIANGSQALRRRAGQDPGTKNTKDGYVVRGIIRWHAYHDDDRIDTGFLACIAVHQASLPVRIGLVHYRREASSPAQSGSLPTLRPSSPNPSD